MGKMKGKEEVDFGFNSEGKRDTGGGFYNLFQCLSTKFLFFSYFGLIQASFQDILIDFYLRSIICEICKSTQIL